MGCQRGLLRLVVAVAALWFLAGCVGPEATAAPPTAAPTIEMAPTATEAPETAEAPTATAPVLASSVEMVMGRWRPLSSSQDAMYLEIRPDGSCRQSFSLERLSESPEVACTYTFEGAELAMTSVALKGVPECPSPTGKYEVRLRGEEQIELVQRQDSCAPRIRSTRGVYQRLP